VNVSIFTAARHHAQSRAALAVCPKYDITGLLHRAGNDAENGY